MSSLMKYFTEEEQAFIQSYAKQRNLDIKLAIVNMVREYIQTYNLKFVSGQQVLMMLDLLAMKIPTWTAIMTNMTKEQAMNIKQMSGLLNAMFGNKPDYLEKILEVLSKPEVKDLLSSLLGLFSSQYTEENEKEEGDDEIWGSDFILTWEKE